MGWSDRREVEFEGSLASIDLNRLTDEQLARISAGVKPAEMLQPSHPSTSHGWRSVMQS